MAAWLANFRHRLHKVCNLSVEPSIQNHNRVLDCVMSSEWLSWRRSGPPRSTGPPHDRVSRHSSVRASCRNQPSPQPHTSPPAVRPGFQSTPCSWASKTSSCSLQTFSTDHQSVARSDQERNHMCLERPRLPGTKPQVL